MHGAIRLIALFEALKGLLVLAAGAGLLRLRHTDLHAFALHLVEHAHLNPAAKVPGIFLEAVNHLENTRLLLLAVGAAAYGALRLVEAYGLWHRRAWAELLSAGSGAIYLPFELVEFARQPSVLHAALVLANVAIVAVMLRALARRRQVAEAA